MKSTMTHLDTMEAYRHLADEIAQLALEKPMTQLEELKAALRAMPKASWYYDDDLSAVVYISGHCVKAAADFGKIDGAKQFGQFIALAHNLMPTLLEAVEALRLVDRAGAGDGVSQAEALDACLLVLEKLK